jgi:GMP synthase (glutamine-hydrolysing)
LQADFITANVTQTIGIPMRVAIVENTHSTHHGQIGVALHEAGAMIDLYKPWADGLLPDPASFDALVVLGGEQNALADGTHPYLPALADLMVTVAHAGKAVLGICLGAQIFARGAGATNHIGTARETGWHQLALTSEGSADPLLSALPAHFDSFEWHSDTFTLPPEAVQLASGAIAPMQAFRLGRAGYATQFHFEASTRVVGEWVKSFGAMLESEHPGFLAARAALAETAGRRADANGLAIARAWVALI